MKAGKNLESIIILIIACGMFISILYRVLVPPVVGLGDNGDFYRIMLYHGLDHIEDSWAPENRYDLYNNFVNLKFQFVEPIETFYRSSYEWNLELSKRINSLLFKDGLYDLRSLALVSAFMLFAAVCTVCYGLRGHSFGTRLFAILIMSLIFSDIAFVEYFNTFYSELGSPIHNLFFFGLFLIYASLGESSGADGKTKKLILKAGLVITMVFSGYLATTSKTQDMGLLLPVSMLLLIVIWDFSCEIVPEPSSRLRKGAFLLIAAVSLLLLITSCLRTNSYKTDTKTASIYDVIFSEISTGTSDVERNLRELGCSKEEAEEFSKYSGTDCWKDGTGYDDAKMIYFLTFKVSYRNIISYYLAHPSAFLRMAGQRSRSMFINSFYRSPDAMKNRFVPYLGNYDMETSRGVLKTCTSMNFWSEFKRKYFLRSLPFAIATLAVSSGFSMFFIFSNTGVPWHRRLLSVHSVNFAIAAMAAIEFVTCMLGDSHREDTKHLFMFNILFDFSFFFLIACAVKAGREFYQRAWPR